MSIFKRIEGGHIRNLQKMLYMIADATGSIQKIIPDGIYGRETEKAVRQFQVNWNLDENGKVDELTWNTILYEYNLVKNDAAAPDPVRLLSSLNTGFAPGESSLMLIPFQAMLQVMAAYFPESVMNHNTICLSGINDANTINAVRYYQRMFGQRESGEITKEFWNDFAALYSVYAARG